MQGNIVEMTNIIDQLGNDTTLAIWEFPHELLDEAGLWDYKTLRTETRWTQQLRKCCRDRSF